MRATPDDNSWLAHTRLTPRPVREKIGPQLAAAAAAAHLHGVELLSTSSCCSNRSRRIARRRPRRPSTRAEVTFGVRGVKHERRGKIKRAEISARPVLQLMICHVFIIVNQM